MGGGNRWLVIFWMLMRGIGLMLNYFFRVSDGLMQIIYMV